MSEALESLLPCICGSQAELHEWEEIDATRWAARVKCNCGWEGPVGYADNWRGCFDAVNNLHKKRAIAAWNKRPAPVAIEPVLRAQQAEIDPLSPEGQRLLYERSPSEPVAEVVDMKYNKVHFYRKAGDTSDPYLQPGVKLYTGPAGYSGDPVEHYIGGRMVCHVMTPPGMTVRFEKEEPGVSRVIVEGAPATDAYRQAVHEMQEKMAKNKERRWVLKLVEERAQAILAKEAK